MTFGPNPREWASRAPPFLLAVNFGPGVVLTALTVWPSVLEPVPVSAVRRRFRFDGHRPRTDGPGI